MGAMPTSSTVRNVVEIITQVSNRSRNDAYMDGHRDGWADRGRDTASGNKARAREARNKREREWAGGFEGPAI